MDADRLQIQTEFNRADRQEQLQPDITHPTASPVDAFERPDAGAQLDQLARALGQVAPEVAQYSDTVARQHQEKDKAAAEASVREALRKGAKTYKDAVTSGAIPASASPWYRMYAKTQMGKALASNMGSDFEVAAARDLQGATDLPTFDKYAAAFQQKWVQDHAGDAQGDLAFAQGFNPTASRVIEGARAAFAEQAGKNLQSQTVSALIQNQAQIIRMGRQNKLSDADIAAQLNAASDQAIAHGVRGDIVNQANASAISNYAESALDSSALGLGALVKAGTGTLQDTGVFSQLHSEAAPYIVRQQVLSDNVAHEAQVRNTELVRAQTMTDALHALNDDPQTDIRPYLAKLYATHDYSAIESLTAHQSSLVRHDDRDDSDQYSQAMAAAESPGEPTITMGHISAMIGNHELTPDHGHELIAILDQRRKDASEKERQNSFRKDPNYIIQTRALTSDFTSSINGKGILSPSYGNAQSSLNAQLQELLTSQSYLTAKPGERAKMADAVRQNVVAAFAGERIGTPKAPVFGLDAGQAAHDTAFAKQLRSEIVAGAFSPATLQELHTRKLLTPADRQQFLKKMGMLNTPVPTP